MTPPRPMQQRETDSGDDCPSLRSELAALADALVDARPTDRPALYDRVRHAVGTQRRCTGAPEELGRLLQHMLTDLSGEAAPVDTLYYARQLVVVADRLPN